MHILLYLSIFGFVVPNGLFLYYALSSPDLMVEALKNPIAAVFITEAMLLVFLIAGVLHFKKINKPSAMQFIGLSLIGSLAFSLPLTLYWNRERLSEDI